MDAATGEPLTSHTTNPVPFILVNYDPAYTLREGGCLADVAPTLLEMMGLEKPEEMTGESLLIRKSGDVDKQLSTSCRSPFQAARRL